MKRDAAAHMRPDILVLASAARRPTRSGSTPAPTMTGALPPSSISTGFMARAASSVRCLPTPVEPVKVTRRVMGEPISLSEICPEFAKDEVQHARREPRVFEAAHELAGSPGGVGGGFQDH